MTDRERLPNRRYAETFTFWHGNFQYDATVGLYPDGRIGEVFLSAGKAGTELDIATRDSAIALSFALQYGCRPETIRAAMTRNSEGKPEGALGVLIDRICELQEEYLSHGETIENDEGENTSERGSTDQAPDRGDL
jgi:hypothetical protein